MAYESDPFGSFPGEQQATQPQAGRFNQMLHNPNMQAEARRVATEIGSGALQGALENNGLVRDDGSIRKFRAARKALTNPTGMARKAAVGAVQGGRQAGMQEVSNQVRGLQETAQQQLGDPFSSEAANLIADPSAQTAVEAVKGKGLFRRDKQANDYAAPVPSGNDDPFGQPATGYGNTMPNNGFPPAATEAFPMGGFPAPQQNQYGGFPTVPNPAASFNIAPGDDPFGGANTYPAPQSQQYGSYPAATEAFPPAGGFPAGPTYEYPAGGGFPQ